MKNKCLIGYSLYFVLAIVLNIMNKNNFFNFKQKNIWDTGFPMSPRKFIIGSITLSVLIIVLAVYYG